MSNKKSTNHDKNKETKKEEHKEHKTISKQKTTAKSDTITIGKNQLYVGIAVILLAIILAFSLMNTDSSDNDGTTTQTGTSDTVKLLVVTDSRCADCDVTPIIPQLEQVLGNVELETVDYTTAEGKKVYEDNGLTTLPALLFTEDVQDSTGFAQVQQFLVPKGDYLSLNVGAVFDPTQEICDNGVDDNENGAIDCADTSCSSNWACLAKVEKPNVELFVMSHCPYGTQMEKGILPVAKLLGDNIDFEVKFVNYAMHGETELDEQLNQYCIKENYGRESFQDYLLCFLEKGEGANCIDAMAYDSDLIATCVEEADAEFGIYEDFADKSTWKGNYPSFSIYNEDNLKYGVRGSPTLVVNGMTDVPAGRDSASIMAAICSTFEDAPEACNTELSSATPSPGFGFGEATTNNLAQCG